MCIQADLATSTDHYKGGRHLHWEGLHFFPFSIFFPLTGFFCFFEQTHRFPQRLRTILIHLSSFHIHMLLRKHCLFCRMCVFRNVQFSSVTKQGMACMMEYCCSLHLVWSSFCMLNPCFLPVKSSSACCMLHETPYAGKALKH